MKEHDWMKLYADAEKFMKKVGGTDMYQNLCGRCEVGL